MPVRMATAPPRDPKSRNVVAMSWSVFLDHMRDHWAPGDHIAGVGPTGEGKTTAAIGLLSVRRYCVALDAKGEDSTLTASGWERIREWPPPTRLRDRIADGHPARLIVGGPSRTEAETARLRQTLLNAVNGVHAEGNWTLLLDEAQVTSDMRMFNLMSRIEQMLVSARSRGISVITLFQQPSWVPRAATRQASWVLLWSTRDLDSVKRVAEAMGRPWRELQAMVTELPPYTFLAIPKQFRDPVVLTRPPKVD